MKGNFPVKLTNNPFRSIPPDQALEVTINKWKKARGSGIIGSTLDKQSVTAWEYNFHEVMAIKNLFREITYINQEYYNIQIHHEFTVATTDLIEENISNLIQYLVQHSNPFEPGMQPLRNIITGELVHQDVNLSRFIKRFIKKSKPINATISQNKFPSFRDTPHSMPKTNPNKKISQDVQEAQSHLNLTAARGYGIANLLEYELRRSNALFDGGDVLKKGTNKSVLIDELLKISGIFKESSDEYGDPLGGCKYSLIIDVMVVCRKIKWTDLKTFRDFANQFCLSVMKWTKLDIARIDFVFDSYMELSPKTGERTRRYNAAGPRGVHRIEEDVELPRQEDPFWASTSNKENLQTFLRGYLTKHLQYIWPSVEIILSATNIQRSQSTRGTLIPNDASIQDASIEEADLRIVLHAAHAVSQGYQKIVVASIDTDVLVLLLHFWDALNRLGLQELWNVRSGADSYKSQLPVHAMAQKIGIEKCKTLLAMHHLTVSDYTSKVGTKRSGLRASPELYLQDFAKDVSTSGTQRAIEEAKSFLVKVVSKKTNCNTFDQLRLWMYEHEQSMTIAYLPPTSESMKLHILRAFYMTYVQTSCLNEDKNELNVLDFGYIKRDNYLVPQNVIEVFPPKSELIPQCGCQRCTNKSCRCVAAGIDCCKYCLCQTEGTCKNPRRNERGMNDS